MQTELPVSTRSNKVQQSPEIPYPFSTAHRLSSSHYDSFKKKKTQEQLLSVLTNRIRKGLENMENSFNAEIIGHKAHLV